MCPLPLTMYVSTWTVRIHILDTTSQVNRLLRVSSRSMYVYAFQSTVGVRVHYRDTHVHLKVALNTQWTGMYTHTCTYIFIHTYMHHYMSVQWTLYKYTYMYMEEHVHSERTPITAHIKAQRATDTDNNIEHTERGVGPWVPSLENWGSRLKSLLRAQLSLHTQCSLTYRLTMLLYMYNYVSLQKSFVHAHSLLWV